MSKLPERLDANAIWPCPATGVANARSIVSGDASKLSDGISMSLGLTGSAGSWHAATSAVSASARQVVRTFRYPRVDRAESRSYIVSSSSGQRPRGLSKGVSCEGEVTYDASCRSHRVNALRDGGLAMRRAL